MKVGIITGVYSENCGTLLQAYAIGKTIESKGHEVFYINTRNKYSTHSAYRMFGRFIKESVAGNFHNAKAAIVKYFKFSKSIKNYNIINLEDIDKLGIKKLVIGSDTVWNIEDLYFNAEKEHYWPIVDDSVDVNSYAAAIGNSKVESFKKEPQVMNSIKRMNNIAVRDGYSKKIISQLTDKPIITVCDPTILADKKIFNIYRKDIPVKDKYILVYIFNNLSQQMVGDITKFAKERNLKIISLGKKYSWVDKQIILSVDNFISYYQKAEYIITNTFHGNVFSLIYNKQFICAPCKNSKVIELHKEFGVTDRRIVEETDTYKIMNQTIDYSVINEKMAKIRTESDNYLTSILGE